jgi:serine/threonine-protein kinase
VIGETLDGSYTIVRLLGQGGMGAVYEAEQLATGRRVAVKVLTAAGKPNASKSASEAEIRRFQREARAAGSVDTRHIVEVLDAGADRETGQPYMVMEYLEGEDLSALVERVGPLPPETALKIVAQACVGVRKAHEAMVIHRDIKPANLFLARRDGEVVVKILDFGIAKVKAEKANAMETAGLTRTGTMLGSPLYMSPEQARGLKDIDHRTDVWSLGMVLYDALAGRSPYDAIDALGELILVICSGGGQPLQELAPWVAPEVAAIVHRATRVAPGERFDDAAEMLRAIEALLPGGAALRESDLVGLGSEQRKTVAPRFVVSAPGSSRSDALDDTFAADAPPPAPASVAAGTTGNVAIPALPPSVRAPARGGARRVALGAAVVAGLAAGAWLLARQGLASSAAPVQAQHAAAAALAPPPATAPPSAGPTVTPSDAPIPSAPAGSAAAEPMPKPSPSVEPAPAASSASVAPSPGAWPPSASGRATSGARFGSLPSSAPDKRPADPPSAEPKPIDSSRFGDRK